MAFAYLWRRLATPSATEQVSEMGRRQLDQAPAQARLDQYDQQTQPRNDSGAHLTPPPIVKGSALVPPRTAHAGRQSVIGDTTAARA